MAFKLKAPAPPIQRKPLKPRSSDVPDFEKLLPTSWREIVFPVSSLKVSFEQDLVEHKYWGVDSASVETTGRGPRSIEAEIPCFNAVAPGRGEKWGELFPTVFRKLQAAFADGTAGPLVHPEQGIVLCKPKSFSFTLDAEKRNGVAITASWIETTDGDTVEVDLFDTQSPFADAYRSAIDLDSAQKDLRGLADEFRPPVFTESFESLVLKLEGAFDRVSTSVDLLLQKPGQILYRLDSLQKSAERLRSPKVWKLNDAIERLRAAVLAIRDVARKPTAIVKSPGKMTLAAMCLLTGSKVDDLIKLNPALRAACVLKPETRVKHYK